MEETPPIHERHKEHIAVNWYDLAYPLLCHVCRTFKPAWKSQWDQEQGILTQLIGAGCMIHNNVHRYFVCDACINKVSSYFPVNILERIEAERLGDINPNQETKRLSFLYHTNGREKRVPSQVGLEIFGSYTLDFVTYLKNGYILLHDILEMRRNCHVEAELMWYFDALQYLHRAQVWIVPDSFVLHIEKPAGWFRRDRALLDSAKEEKGVFIQTRPIVHIT